MVSVPSIQDGERDELRLALSLSGGVSLAVWIGGVTFEVDRTRIADGAWAEALELTSTDLTVDVISGTSAGGINGAVLALAIARDARTDEVRSLWVNSAGLESLLRKPTADDARSLFLGDDYLLQVLSGVFDQLAAVPPPEPDQPLPNIHLTLTGTLLRGVSNQLPDDFGAIVADVSHRARFRFRRDLREGIDDFTKPNVAKQLARAARSTASFPGAFEASFVKVGETKPEERKAAEALTGTSAPDMRGVVNFPSSRWVIDGGLLANQPLGDTLQAIYAQRADRQVRRTVLLVSPDPAAPVPDSPDESDDAPSLGRVLLGSLAAPWTQSLSGDLVGYREHNRRVRQLHDSRDALVGGLAPDRAIEMADGLFEVYRDARRRSSGRYVRDQFVELVGHHVEGAESLDWEQNALYRQVVDTERLPWLPEQAAGAIRCIEDVAGWGLFPLERTAGALLNVLTRALRAAGTADHRHAIAELLGRCYDDVLRPARAQRGRTARTQREAVEQADMPNLVGAGDSAAQLQAWVGQVVAAWIDDVSADVELGAEVVRIAARLGGLAVDLGAALAESVATAGVWVEPAEKETLQHWAAWLRVDDPAEALRRLLVFEVLETSFGSNDIEVDQLIRFVQLGGDTPCPAIASPIPVEDKITGAQLGHFGAFLKRSWRANDWMWGRLDAAVGLSRIVLDPVRLRQLYPPAPGVPGKLHPDLRVDDDPLGRLEDIVAGDGPDRDYLRRQLHRRELVVETEFLRDTRVPTPASLPQLAAAFARRRHLEILREELPHLYQAVLDDDQQGRTRSTAGRDFQAAYEAEGDGPLTAEAAERLLRGCRIRAEKALDEVGTPTMTQATVATIAGAANALNTATAAYQVFQGPVGALRRLTLAAYWLQTTRRDSSPVAQWSIAGALGAAFTVVVLSFFASGVPAWLQAASWAVLFGGVLLLALTRRRSTALAVTVLAAAGVGVLTWWGLRQPVDLTSVRVLVAGLAATLTAVVFGKLLHAVRRSRLRLRAGNRAVDGATDVR